MKRLIASDIHGSLAFCQKLLDLYERERAQELILLGDLAFSGVRDPAFLYDPQGVVELLDPLARRIYCVEGNCDYALSRLNPAFSSEPNCMLARWEDWTGFLTHGHWYGPQNPPPMGTAQVLLSGHTHVPSYERMGDLICANPGSVSLPRGGSPHSCLIWEDGLLRWLTLAGEEYRRETLPADI